MRFLILALAIFTTALQAQSIKIGYINVGHLVTSSPHFIQANKNIVAEFKPREEKLIKLGEEVQSLTNKLNENKEKLSKAEIDAEIKKITDLERDLKQKASTLRQELQAREKQELGKIEQLVNQVIKETAQKQNFDLILYQEVAYVSKKINITQTISKKLRDLFEQKP